MKVSKVLMSAVLVLAMLLSMFACAEGDAFTLRNVKLNLAGEEIVIGPAAVLSADDEDDGSVKLHFELQNGENVYLPVSLQLENTGNLRFSLGDSGRVYTISPEILLAMLDLSEEDAQVFALIGKMLSVIEELEDWDPDDEEAKQFGVVADRFFATCTNSEGQVGNVEICDQTFAGVSYKGGMTLTSMCSALDYMRTCGIQVWEDYTNLILDIYNIAGGTQSASVEEWVKAQLQGEADEAAVAEFMNEELMNMEFVIGGDQDAEGVRMTMSMEVEGEEISFGMEMLDTENDEIVNANFNIDVEGAFVNMNIHSDETATSVLMDWNVDDGYSVTTLNLDVYAAKQDDDVVSFDAKMNMDTVESYESEDSAYSYKTAVVLEGSGAEVNDLWNTNLTLTTTNEYSYGADAEPYSDSATYSFDYVETDEADGSETASIALAMDAYGLQYGLSFEVNEADDVRIADLPASGDNVYALTVDTEDATYALLSADAMGLYSDLLEVLADPGISAIVEMLSASEADTMQAYDDDNVDITSVEEAAGIFGNTLPAFTLPEGFEFSYGYANSGYVDIYFASGERMFNYYVTDFGVEMESAGPDFSSDEYGNTYAEYQSGTNYIMVVFDASFEQAEIDSILTGLSL